MKVLTIETAREVLRRLVNMKTPDYRYDNGTGLSSCYYVLDGKPSCLIGHLLVDQGVSPDEIKDWEGSSAHSVLPQFFDFETPDLLDALNKAQRKQDGGAPWGEALEAFEAAL